MSRIDELKKQFPELNMTMFDLFKRIDTSSTYKYFPLLCKILGKKFNLYNQYEGDRRRMDNIKLEIHDSLLSRGIATDGLTDNELYSLSYLTDYYNNDMLLTIKEFIRLMDKKQIENNDVTSYSTIDDLRSAITLASIKELTKELEGQVIKEYEDDKWLVVRPLTFQASAKYGASTRWCTTYQKEKQYFEKYWQYGILVYFINKVTGYKFAGYRSLKDGDELSFWNAEDNRVDYLNVDADDYLFPIVRRILGSKKTNKELCSTEIQNQVMKECGYNVKKMSIEPYDEPMMEREVMEMDVRGEQEIIARPIVTRNMFTETMDRMEREISEGINEMVVQELVNEARTYHNNTLQGVRDIGVHIEEDVREVGYDEGPMREGPMRA
jgi:hypothetical protein